MAICRFDSYYIPHVCTFTQFQWGEAIAISFETFQPLIAEQSHKIPIRSAINYLIKVY